MNLQTILQKFSIISKAKLTDSNTWVSICEDSIKEIEVRLKKDVDPEAPMNCRRLETAVATLALYKYTLYNNVSNTSMESFSAGEIRIRTNSNSAIKVAYQMWKQAENSISDLLIDETFAFERIVFE